MTTWNVSDAMKNVHSQAFGNRVVFQDKSAEIAASTDLATADVIRLCKVPAGTLVDRVTIKNHDLDANGTPTLTADIGFIPMDGSTGGDVDIVAAAAITLQAATTSAAPGQWDVFPPYKVTEDCYLALTVVTGAATASAAAGYVYGKVEGECLGAA